MVDSGSALVDRFETSLAPDPVSAGVARRFVRDHLDENRVVDGWVDTAELLVSELVTNALMHAGTGIGLAVSVFVGAVRVEVADGNPAHPVRRPAHETPLPGGGSSLSSCSRTTSVSSTLRAARCRGSVSDPPPPSWLRRARAAKA